NFVGSRERAWRLCGADGRPFHPRPPCPGRRFGPDRTLRRRRRRRGFDPRRAEPRRRQCRTLLPLAADRAGGPDVEQRRGPRDRPLILPASGEVAGRRPDGGGLETCTPPPPPPSRRSAVPPHVPGRIYWRGSGGVGKAAYLMSGRGPVSGAARLLCAVGCVTLSTTPALAQIAPAPPPPPSTQPELDPNAPMAPMPDLGVDWPDLNAKDTVLSPQPGTPIAQPTPRAGTTEATGTIRYTADVEGLSTVGAAEDLLKAFRQQSTLDAERKDPANAAQIGRRANADADLLTQLLRSRGYYDAAVEPRTERSGDMLRVILTADPGVQYRFASVGLPGLEAAGADAAKLRSAFAVKAGDPVIAQE